MLLSFDCTVLYLLFWSCFPIETSMLLLKSPIQLKVVGGYTSELLGVDLFSERWNKLCGKPEAKKHKISVSGRLALMTG